MLYQLHPTISPKQAVAALINMDNRNLAENLAEILIGGRIGDADGSIRDGVKYLGLDDFVQAVNEEALEETERIFDDIGATLLINEEESRQEEENVEGPNDRLETIEEEDANEDKDDDEEDALSRSRSLSRLASRSVSRSASGSLSREVSDADTEILDVEEERELETADEETTKRKNVNVVAEEAYAQLLLEANVINKKKQVLKKKPKLRKTMSRKRQEMDDLKLARRLNAVYSRRRRRLRPRMMKRVNFLRPRKLQSQVI